MTIEKLLKILLQVMEIGFIHNMKHPKKKINRRSKNNMKQYPNKRNRRSKKQVEMISVAKENYIIMGAGLATILIGFQLTALDKDVDGFFGRTLAPCLIILGYFIVALGILYTSKNSKRTLSKK